MDKVFISESETDTKSFAKKLVHYLNPGDVLTLSGDLGAGKTTFTKGIATGLGIKRIVTSPTFTIIKEYTATIPLYHMDTYRLENSEEDIGFDEYFYGNGITVIEWAEFIDEFLPENRLEITLTQVNDTSRKITVHPIGDHYVNMIKEFKPPKGVVE